jgi:hypothetical protein
MTTPTLHVYGNGKSPAQSGNGKDSSQPRKTLAQQIDKLDQILDGLDEALHGAISDAVTEAVDRATNKAVQAAVSAVLGNPVLLRIALARCSAPTDDPYAELARTMRQATSELRRAYRWLTGRQQSYRFTLIVLSK